MGAIAWKAFALRFVKPRKGSTVQSWIISFCGTAAVLLIPAHSVLAQAYYSNGYYETTDASGYAPPSKSLLPAAPLEACEFNRPPAFLGTFALDFLFLSRSNVDSFNLVDVNGSPTLNAQDLDFDETLTYRLSATIPSDCGCDLQLLYLGSHGFDTSATFQAALVQDRFFGLTGAITDLEIQHESELDSFEVNIRTRQWERLVPLAGIRYARINEQTLQIDLLTNTAFTGGADNEMVGFQFGAEALLGQLGPLRLETTLKAGAYYNAINVSGSTASDSFDRLFSNTALLAEANLMLVYKFGDHLTARFGYQLVWFDGVGLLFDQYDDFDVTTGNGSVDLGSVMYHGGFVGFDLTW